MWPLYLLAAGAAAYLLIRDAGPEERVPTDPGVRPDIKRAVTFAYLYEKDAGNLHAFGTSLLPDLPVSAHTLLTKSTQSVQGVGAFPQQLGFDNPPGSMLRRMHGLQLVGSIWDLDNYTDAAAAVVSTTVDVITHPADTASGAWHAITHPTQSISDFANALVDALHAIPGMDEAGELLKDFAKTTFGEWCLRILSTFGYYVMAPYLGAQLAAVSFALPGVAKAEPFMQSWIIETMDRVIKTINLLLAGALGDVSRAADEAVNKALAQAPDVQALVKEFTAQIGKGSKVLVDKLGADLARKVKEGASDAFDEVTRKLRQEYGYPPDFSKIAREAGIREDNAAAAYDLLARTTFQTTTLWDPFTGEDIEAHLYKSRFQGVTADGLYASGEGAFIDPRTMSVEQLEGLRLISITDLLNKPERQRWVDHYLGRAWFAESGLVASTSPEIRYEAPTPGGGFSIDPAITAAQAGQQTFSSEGPSFRITR